MLVYRPMNYYYLGIPVEIVQVPNEKGYLPDPDSGWVNARWLPDGKVWTHWRPQLAFRYLRLVRAAA